MLRNASDIIQYLDAFVYMAVLVKYSVNIISLLRSIYLFEVKINL